MPAAAGTSSVMTALAQPNQDPVPAGALRIVQSWTWVKDAAPAMPATNSKMRTWTMDSARSVLELRWWSWAVTAPALLGCLPGDAEPGADVSPAVAVAAQPGDGVADGGVEVVGERGHVGDGVDVAGGDAAAVGADDAPGEGGVLVVLDDRPAPSRLSRIS